MRTPRAKGGVGTAATSAALPLCTLLAIDLKPHSGDLTTYKPRSGDLTTYKPHSGDLTTYKPRSGDFIF